MATKPTKRRTKDEQIADIKKKQERELDHAGLRADIAALKTAHAKRHYGVVRTLARSIATVAGQLDGAEVEPAPAPAQQQLDVTEGAP